MSLTATPFQAGLLNQAAADSALTPEASTCHLSFN
jgi:hypothetical protein